MSGNNVQGLVQKAVQQINEDNEVKVENQVVKLVNDIIRLEADITKLQGYVTKCKAELKELEMPTPVVLEI